VSAIGALIIFVTFFIDCVTRFRTALENLEYETEARLSQFAENTSYSLVSFDYDRVAQLSQKLKFSYPILRLQLFGPFEDKIFDFGNNDFEMSTKSSFVVYKTKHGIVLFTDQSIRYIVNFPLLPSKFHLAVNLDVSQNARNLAHSVLVRGLLMLSSLMIQFFLIGVVTRIATRDLTSVTQKLSSPNNLDTPLVVTESLSLEVAALLEALNDKIVEQLRNQKVMQAAARDSAIARTTQALAHDVRKPFTMFKMIIDAVQGENDPEEAKLLLKESLPEVQQAMASVNGMISDVLEIGSDSKLVTEFANPESLVEATLNEIFRVYPNSEISIAYDFQHTFKVQLDTLKMGRVFSNIVGNAVQAVGKKGKLWFKTQDIEENGMPFVLFCLGNDGSFIPSQNFNKLFEAFFTSGKKEGTGLGLAIAKKIVTAHGGRIWCESTDENNGEVEFYFTLPRASVKSDFRTQTLPTSSHEIVVQFERFLRQTPSHLKGEVDPGEAALEQEIIKIGRGNRAPLDVLIVDDEGIYRNSLTALLNRSDELKSQLNLSYAHSPTQALEEASKNPALIILDIDLGDNLLDGYEVLKKLRSQNYVGVVCIHSNRSSPDDYKAAIEVKADAVLPKPMSRAHFLKLILQAAERVQSNTSKPVETLIPEFAVIDDSLLVLKSWELKSKGQAKVHTFSSPELFWEAVNSEQCLLSKFEFIVTDFYFAPNSIENGITFATKIKKKYAGCRLLRSLVPQTALFLTLS
jgi:signal transduction histidine kinase/DNA-binding response OmpR family regulator